MKKKHRIWLPIFIILIGIILVIIVIIKRSKPQEETVIEKLPLVKTQLFYPDEIKISIHGAGIVEPENSVNIVPQVSGNIIEVTENAKEGAIFHKGDIGYWILDIGVNILA